MLFEQATKPFLDWGEDDGTVVYSGALTSADDLGGASVVGASASSVTYTNDGIGLASNRGLNLLPALSAAQLAEVKKGFTMTAWVEKEFFTEVGTATLYLFGGGFQGMFGTQLGSYPRLVSGADSSDICNVTSSEGTHVRVDLSFVMGTIRAYVNKFPVCGMDGLTFAATVFGTHWGLGNWSSGGAISNRIKNLTVRNRSVRLAVPSLLSKAVCFGHSYFINIGGDYANDNQWIKSGTGSQDSGDETQLAQLHRRLNQHGVNYGHGQIRNEAQGNAFSVSLSTQETSAFADGQHYSLAIINIGVNDAVGVEQDIDITSPTFVADVQATIDACTTAGVTKIILMNSPSMVASTSKTAAIFEANIIKVNGYIDGLVAANAEAHLIDVYGAFGGNNYDINNLYMDNGIHPTLSGNAKEADKTGFKLLGNLLADKIIQLLTAG